MEIVPDNCLIFTIITSIWLCGLYFSLEQYLHCVRRNGYLHFYKHPRFIEFAKLFAMFCTRL